MDRIDAKQCPQCAEQIKLTAKKCPFCMTLQIKKPWYRNPQTLGMLPFLLIMGNSIFNIFTLNRRTDLHFQDYVQKVNATSAEMFFETTGSPPTRTLTVIGTVRNDSDITWADPEYAVDFYDKAGKLVDTQTTGHTHVKIASHQEQGFRVQLTPAKPSEHYATVKVRIRSAEDADRFSRH